MEYSRMKAMKYFLKNETFPFIKKVIKPLAQGFIEPYYTLYKCKFNREEFDSNAIPSVMGPAYRNLVIGLLYGFLTRDPTFFISPANARILGFIVSLSPLEGISSAYLLTTGRQKILNVWERAKGYDINQRI